MLRVQLICTGKLKESFYTAACEEYNKRLQRYCALEILELPESGDTKRDGAAMLSRIGAGAFVVALCIEGKSYSSEELAALLGQCAVQGKSRVCFLIGGSDGLSGITANPVVGRFSDMLVAQGGSTVLTEGPEMFGAEGFLMNRCAREEVFHKAVDMINGFKEYFISHNEVVYDNPSPGNRQGGITTLEDKSCGCVQKGGSAPIMDVIGYGDAVTEKGLNMLYGPGNDLVSSTALTAAGAHMILFTTGRGTPFGAPAPTMKLSTNTPLYEKKRIWIDFNTGVVADGSATLDETAARLMDAVLEIASGKRVKAEERGFREISIFKDGVTL